MAKHDIPEDVKNSDLIYLIDEFVRYERDREILKDHWFRGFTFEKIADKNDMSVTQVKKIIYDVGDKMLLKLN